MRTYNTYQPADLKSVIKKITVITDSSSPAVPNSIPYFANGLPGIYYQESGYNIFLNGDEKKLSRLFIYGQTVKPIEISTIGPFKAIIVHLYPPALKTLFSIDAYELTDDCMDYSLLPYKDASDVKEKLLEQNSTQHQIDILTGALMKLLYTVQPSANNEVYYAMNRISVNKGLVSLGSLEKELNISERTLQRKFKQYVGITPNLFRRICTFKAVLGRMENRSFNNLTDLAYDYGFSDQSHFIRVFKEFTGCTPGEYLLDVIDSD